MWKIFGTDPRVSKRRIRPVYGVTTPGQDDVGGPTFRPRKAKPTRRGKR